MTASDSLGRRDVDSLPRRARLRYYLGVLVTAGLVLEWLFSPPSWIKIHPGLLALLALYTFVSLRSDHEYYVVAAQRGCSPAPHLPRDFWGIRYLFETLLWAKRNALLQHRDRVLEAFKRTYVHDMFGESSRCVTTDEPENVRALLCSRFEDWDLPTLRIRGFLPVLGAHSIFTTNGPEWQHSRAILRPAFVRDQISDLACIDRHVSNLVAQIPKDGNPVDLQDMLSKMTTDSISDFMLGHSTNLLGNAPEDSHKFAKFFDASMQKIGIRTRLGWLTVLRPDRELDEYCTFMRRFLRQFVNDVRDHADDNTYRDDTKKYVFLEELIKSGESDEVICDHLLSILTAGRDTTTSVLSYMFLELAQRPEIVMAIRKEIYELGDVDPTWEQLRNMRYLNWVLKEALRLNPPVAINSREAVRDTILPRGGGVDGKSPVFIRQGTVVRYSPWTMQRRKDLYGEDAEEFRPERWEKLRVTHEYVPFNAGPRICIGQQFALTQIALITVRILQAFKAIERRDDRPPVQKLGVNLSLLNGCMVSLTPA